VTFKIELEREEDGRWVADAITMTASRACDALWAPFTDSSSTTSAARSWPRRSDIVTRHADRRGVGDRLARRQPAGHHV